ncbi:MAG: cytochrome b [Alphaproteobacteria bacterium]
MKSTKQSYGRFAVSIHWLSAILILVLLGSGLRSDMTLDPAVKIMILRVHIPVAILVLVLTVVRLVWWWRFDKKPAPLDGTPSWQESIAVWTHRLLYVLLFVMLGSGIGLSILSGAPDAVFGNAELPDFSQYPPRIAHGIAAKILAGLIVLHAGAALFHHFMKRDVTLKRMWFQKSSS